LRKFKGFDFGFEDFYLLGAYHPIFVEISRGKMNRSFQV